MLKAKILIDNNTASGDAPIDWIRKYILRNSELVEYNKETHTVTYKNEYATIYLVNVRQI